MTHFRFVALALVLSAGCVASQEDVQKEKARVAAQEEAQKERTKLEGAWVALAFEESGKKYEGPRARFLEGMSWEFKGDEFTWRAEGKIEMKGSYKIDPANTPKEIDLIDSNRKVNSVGIYDLQGDTLKIRFHLEEEARPTAFTTERNTRNHFLLVLKRSKG